MQNYFSNRVLSLWRNDKKFEMNAAAPEKSVERLFPFVMKSRALIPGRDALSHSKSDLHFVLITSDISATSRINKPVSKPKSKTSLSEAAR